MSTFQEYRRESLRPDLIAGLTVAVMGVPQAMAYAMIAELPPVFGLYTAIVSCAVAALLGSSHHLVTGPTNALCMVLLSLVGPIARDGAHDPIEVVLFLTFLTGALQLGFGFLRLGGIVRYVSNSVVVGFTVGAGILIAVNQLKNILGVDLSAHGARRFHEVLMATASELPHANGYAVAVGLVAVALTLLIPRVDRRIPAGLVGVVAAGALAAFAGWSAPDMGTLRVETVRDIEPISGNLLAMFRLPGFVTDFDLGLARDLIAGAAALALIGFLEAASIARTIAAKSGQRLDFNQEFIGQGASKVAGAFCSCFASSGSFTRSSVCFKSGGKTRMAAVFSAVWTAAIVALLAPLANHIPKAALAGLLLVVAASMVDRRRLRNTWRAGPSSRVVLAGTLAATLVLPLQYAIFVGVVLSVINLLRETGRMHLTHLVSHPVSGFEEVPFNRAGSSPVVTINLEGALYFAAADDLDYELLRCLHDETEVVVLRMKRLRAAGSTAMAMLEHYEELLRSRGIDLVVCGIEDHLEGIITRSGLREKIGEQNIFFADNHLLRSTELAHARAWSLVESRRRMRATASGVRPPVDASSGPVVGEMMSRQCIRFGNRHPLREALWLMSEMKKGTTTAAPLPLFIQDREGRLFGELSVWRILAGATAGQGNLSSLDNGGLRARMRERFDVQIATLARTDLPLLVHDTPFEEALRAAQYSRLPVLPVRDAQERLVGHLDSIDLLRGVARMLELPPGARQDGDDGSVSRLRPDATFRDALDRFLLHPSDRAPRTLLATDDDGRYRGIITPSSLLRATLEASGDRDVPRARDDVLSMTAMELLHEDAPIAAPAAPLGELLDRLLVDTLEAIPLLHDERAVGMMTVVDVFTTVAELALNPEDRVIDVSRKG